MTHPTLGEQDPLKGSFALCLLDAGPDRVTHLRGWEPGRWWNSPMLFWDDFCEDGELGPEPAAQNAVGALCLQRTIAPRRDEGLHVPAGLAFSQSHAASCGWSAPKGDENTVIGNHYCTRFHDAWEAAEYTRQQPGTRSKSRRAGSLPRCARARCRAR